MKQIMLKKYLILNLIIPDKINNNSFEFKF